MRTLSESQAQELADLIWCFICADLDGTVCAFQEKPRIDYDEEQMNWYPSDFNCFTLPIKIESNKPWYEQIWGPA